MPFSLNFVSIFLLFNLFIFPFSIALPLPFPLPPPFLQAQEDQICPAQWSPPFAGANLCVKVINKTATYSAAIKACESIGPNASLLDVAHFGNAEFHAMVDNHIVKPEQIYWVKNGGTKNCTELVFGANATERTEVLPLGNGGLCELENPFICQMKPIETTTTITITTTTVSKMSSTTASSTQESKKTTKPSTTTTSPPLESTTTSTTTPIQNSTVPPAANGGCGDEYEIQLYLEIQG